jgi:hypothetical protein
LARINNQRSQKIWRSHEKNFSYKERERVTYLENNELKFFDSHLAFDGGPEIQSKKQKWETKKAKKKKKPKRRKKKGYHEKEHRVCKSASHSKQSCWNSNSQRPPLPFETLCVFVRVSEREKDGGSLNTLVPLCLSLQVWIDFRCPPHHICMPIFNLRRRIKKNKNTFIKIKRIFYNGCGNIF